MLPIVDSLDYIKIVYLPTLDDNNGNKSKQSSNQEPDITPRISIHVCLIIRIAIILINQAAESL